MNRRFKVTASTPSKNNQFMKVPLNKLVNQLGKYLYNHIDGALNLKTSVNQCDVEMMVLYQLPIDKRTSEEDGQMKEMYIDINITTYQNKLRINVLEISPEEKTLGCFIFKVETIVDYDDAKEKVLSKIKKALNREYADYDFIF